MAQAKKPKAKAKFKFDKEKLKGFQDTKILRVLTPEWSDIGISEVYVRSMTSASRDNYEKAVYYAGVNGDQLDNRRANMAIASVCDEKGELLFSPNDIEWLGTKSGAAMDRIYSKANELAGISEEDIAEMEKHLKAGQS